MSAIVLPQAGSVAAIFGLWFIGAIFLHHAELRILWNKNWNGGYWRFALLRNINSFWSLVPLTSLFFIELTLEWVTSLVLLFLILSRFLNRLHQKRSAQYSSRAQVMGIPWYLSAAANRIAMVILLMVTLIAARTSGWYWLINVAIVLLFQAFASKARRDRDPARAIELKDFPIFQELTAIANQLGRVITTVYASTNAHEQAGPLFAYRAPDEKTYGVVQFSAMRDLNPAALTAGVALLLASEEKTRLNLIVLLVFTPLVLFMGLALAGWQLEGPFFLALLIPIIMRMHSDVYLRAWLAWENADETGQRTPQDFVNAVAEQHAYFHGITDPEIVLHQLELSPYFRLFLQSDIVGPDPCHEATLNYLGKQTHLFRVPGIALVGSSTR